MDVLDLLRNWSLPVPRCWQFIAGLALLAGGGVCANAADDIDFNRDIRPILSENCFQCHGPDSGTREADLRLDRQEDALADRGGYAAIVPGDIEASEFVRRITSEDEFELMPPADSHKSLKPEQIALLKRWVAEGAPWSPAWSYVPPKRHEPPTVKNESWSKNWIDRFVLARLEREGLSPNKPADPVTLVRRLYFDLTGLPPTPEVVEEFVADPSDAAYEKLVDELLASPHYGERMAVMWLDLVRFADTVGYHGDQTHNVWPFRDYVIHSFNHNKPFNEFTREQLAGDLLPNATEDQTIASGYNRLLQTSHEGGNQLKEYRAIYLADRVRNVSLVWMGATVGCAQCHDHKYDPYTAKDFYSLGAFFADVEDEAHITGGDALKANALPTKRPPEKEVLSIYQRQRLAEIDREIAGLNEQLDKEEIAVLKAEKERIVKHKPLMMYSNSIEPRIVRVLARGDWQDETGEIVGPAVPEFMGKVETERPRPSRLDLANWLTSETTGIGGLTARVMVNRYWALLFGEGLARVLDDFGGQGEPPSHPELLDNLAVEYLDSGWDTKHMMKIIVMSNAYRQSSLSSDELKELDPLNKLLARQTSFRLPAEGVRDTLLSVSGLLDPSIGGRSVRPYQPPKVYQHLNFPKREYKQDPGSEQWRRAVYMHWQRTFLHPMLKAFDASTREECAAKRPRSNTALAALTLLNDPNSVEAARALASRILAEQEYANDKQRIEFAYRLATSRLPDDTESDVLEKLLSAGREYYGKDTAQSDELLSIGMSKAGENLPPAELAAWTTVSRAILNMGETITRN
jgi:hypothetical protein